MHVMSSHILVGIYETIHIHVNSQTVEAGVGHTPACNRQVPHVGPK